MSKVKSKSPISSFLVFIIFVVLTAIAILIETNVQLSVVGQIAIKASYLGIIFGLNKGLDNKLSKMLFSMPLMSIMVLLFFFSVAIATGVETYYDTTTALKVIYKAPWFEWIIFILFVNLIANIVRYSLFKKDKIGSFVFHASFLVIVIGAFVTRNFSFEGMMSIPEGTEASHILSSETYLQIKIDDADQQYSYDIPMLVSEHTANYFSHDIEFPGHESQIRIQYNDFLPNYLSVDTLKTVENGSDFLHIVTVGESSRKNNYLKDGGVLLDNGLKLSFNNSEDTDAIKIVELDSGYFVMSPYDLSYLQMSDQSEGIIKRDSLQRFLPMRLYMVGGIQFVFKQVFENAEIEKIESTHNPMGMDNFVVTVFNGDESKTVYLPGGKGLYSDMKSFEFGGLNYRLSFGSKLIELPFAIRLRDFQLETYPGTSNPSSYASEVTVVDGDFTLDHRIYMNNVLDYKGYRFFQSSYSIGKDGESTVLSVNHDWWGTLITYLGYSLMGLGFILALFTRGSRFVFLLKKSDEIRMKREGLKTIALLIGLTSSLFSFGQDVGHSEHDGHDHGSPITEKGEYVPVDAKHADDFGHLIIHDPSGRFTPVHTTAVNILRKVSRQDSYEGQTAMQVFVGLHTDFTYWFEEPIIYVSGDSTKALLGTPESKYAKMSDFYSKEGKLKLRTNVEIALSKDPKQRSVFEKNIIKTDERFNILSGVVMGYYLKIFPVKNDPMGKWYAPAAIYSDLKGEDSTFVSSMMSWYVYSVQDSKKTGDWSEADKVLKSISSYQIIASDSEAIPSKDMIKLEVLYNKYNLYKYLSLGYLLVGLALLLLQFIIIFKPQKTFKWPMRIGVSLLALFGLFHLTGLIVRWILSEHAPWSNGYEVLVFIAFGTIVIGLFFSKKSKIVMAATGILAWLMLFVSGMSNMDPQMTNLEPVLKSYWLQIHVAIITYSYAFLGVSAILAIINLFIDIFKTEKTKKRLNLTAKELRHINEMIMTIGLFMLTIGTFLGGVWANESWGRYWGWDAKETWALASVLVYSIILHFRYVPGLKSDFTFNFWSLWGFSSIIMTFYGVNYYLSGLHSYATGEPVPIPGWVYVTVAIFAVLSTLAWLNKNKLQK